MTRARDLANSADKDIAGTLAVDGLDISVAAGGSSEMLFSDNVSGRAKILYDHGASPNEEMGFEIAGSRYMTIENGGNVGIGVSDPSQKLDLVGTGNSGTGSVRAGGVGSGTQAAFIAQSQFGSASFGTYGSYPAVLNSSNSPMVYFNTNSSGRAVFAEGITFNGDTAAANALDDYEEGTWTPVDGSGASLSFTAGATANYIKIGRLVLFNFYVTYPSTSSTATAQIGGLPYAVTSSGFFYANYRALGQGANNLLIQLNQGSTVMSLYNSDNGYANSSLSSAYFLASGSYMTS